MKKHSVILGAVGLVAMASYGFGQTPHNPGGSQRVGLIQDRFSYSDWNAGSTLINQFNSQGQISIHKFTAALGGLYTSWIGLCWGAPQTRTTIPTIQAALLRSI